MMLSFDLEKAFHRISYSHLQVTALSSGINDSTLKRTRHSPAKFALLSSVLLLVDFFKAACDVRHLVP